MEDTQKKSLQKDISKLKKFLSFLDKRQEQSEKKKWQKDTQQP